jgi:hypothetical protein
VQVAATATTITYDIADSSDQPIAFDTQHALHREGYRIWYEDTGATQRFINCGGTTGCSFISMNEQWVGDLDECAALCANFAFTNFTSSTCYKLVSIPSDRNCHLFLWDANTTASSLGSVVLSDCALRIRAVCESWYG